MLVPAPILRNFLTGQSRARSLGQGLGLALGYPSLKRAALVLAAQSARHSKRAGFPTRKPVGRDFKPVKGRGALAVMPRARHREPDGACARLSAKGAASSEKKKGGDQEFFHFDLPLKG